MGERRPPAGTEFITEMDKRALKERGPSRLTIGE